MRIHPTPIFDNGLELKEYQQKRIAIELNEKVNKIIYEIKREIDRNPHMKSIDFVENGKYYDLYKLINENKEIEASLIDRDIKINHTNKVTKVEKNSFLAALYFITFGKNIYKEESANVYTITW